MLYIVSLYIKLFIPRHISLSLSLSPPPPIPLLPFFSLSFLYPSPLCSIRRWDQDEACRCHHTWPWDRLALTSPEIEITPVIDIRHHLKYRWRLSLTSDITWNRDHACHWHQASPEIATTPVIDIRHHLKYRWRLSLTQNITWNSDDACRCHQTSPWDRDDACHWHQTSPWEMTPATVRHHPERWRLPPTSPFSAACLAGQERKSVWFQSLHKASITAKC